MNRLYLVRHGQSVSDQVDSKRPLTKKGRADVAKLADFLKGLDISVSVVWHSGKTRAAQTAEIIGSAVKSRKGVVERQGLSPNDSVDNVALEINSSDGDIMIVGHLPFVGYLTTYMTIGRTDDAIGFNESSIACLEQDHGDKWRLTWMVHPGIL